jgi:hypothetical protein
MESTQSNDDKRAVDPAKNTTAPVPESTETNPLYRTFFNQELTSNDVEELDGHLHAILKILGIKWQSDEPLSHNVLGAYIRKEDEFATLITGSNLPGGESGFGIEAQTVLVARAIALHLSTITNGLCDNVQAVWTWEPPTRFSCKNTCHVQESLNPCAMCRLNSVCRLKE